MSDNEIDLPQSFEFEIKEWFSHLYDDTDLDSLPNFVQKDVVEKFKKLSVDNIEIGDKFYEFEKDGKRYWSEVTTIKEDGFQLIWHQMSNTRGIYPRNYL